MSKCIGCLDSDAQGLEIVYSLWRAGQRASMCWARGSNLPGSAAWGTSFYSVGSIELGGWGLVLYGAGVWVSTGQLGRVPAPAPMAMFLCLAQSYPFLVQGLGNSGFPYIAGCGWDRTWCQEPGVPRASWGALSAHGGGEQA